MTNTETTEWFSAKNLTLLILISGVLYLMVTNLVDSRFNEIESATRAQADAQHEVLVDLAESIKKNEADDVVKKLVRDCSASEREEFEGLLNRLDDNLGEQELTKLQSLFGRCGSFYADRKLVMVSRLEREVEAYEAYADQLSVVTNTDQASKLGIEEWNSLLDIEIKRAELFSRLAPLQESIIIALQNGRSPDSPEITEILQEVTEVKELLFVVSKQTEKLRAELLPL